MRLNYYSKLIACCSVLGAVSACSAPVSTTQIVSFSANEITIAYATSLASFDSAKDIALKWCATKQKKNVQAKPLQPLPKKVYLADWQQVTFLCTDAATSVKNSK